MKIAVAKGDGIGPEIMDAVLGIFNAGKVPLEYVVVEMEIERASCRERVCAIV